MERALEMIVHAIMEVQKRSRTLMAPASDSPKEPVTASASQSVGVGVVVAPAKKEDDLPDSSSLPPLMDGWGDEADPDD